MTVAELLARISSAELGEWIGHYQMLDEEWAEAHPQTALPKPATADGRPLNMRGTE